MNSIIFNTLPEIEINRILSFMKCEAIFTAEHLKERALKLKAPIKIETFRSKKISVFTGFNVLKKYKFVYIPINEKNIFSYLNLIIIGWFLSFLFNKKVRYILCNEKKLSNFQVSFLYIAALTKILIKPVIEGLYQILLFPKVIISLANIIKSICSLNAGEEIIRFNQKISFVGYYYIFLGLLKKKYGYKGYSFELGNGIDLREQFYIEDISNRLYAEKPPIFLFSVYCIFIGLIIFFSLLENASLIFLFYLQYF